MKPTRMSAATEVPARLKDAEWAALEPLVRTPKPVRRPAKYIRRAILCGVPPGVSVRRNIDHYGDPADIDADAGWLSRCGGVVVHCRRLAGYFEPFTPTARLDHPLKYTALLRRTFRPARSCGAGFGPTGPRWSRG